MSKYPVQYQSSSKGVVDIEDMALPHLLNAWRKLEFAALTDGTPAEVKGRVLMRECMEEEIVARGCTYNKETERWDLPPAPAEGVDK